MASTRRRRDGRDRRRDERDGGVAVDARFVDCAHGASPFDPLGVIIVAAHVPPAGAEGQTERSADQAEPHDCRAGIGGSLGEGSGTAGERTGSVFANGRLERSHLGERQGPPLPRREMSVLEWTDANPYETTHRMAHRLAHAADLTVASLVNGEADDVGLGERSLGRRGHAVVELDAVAAAFAACSAWAGPRRARDTPSRHRTTDASSDG